MRWLPFLTTVLAMMMTTMAQAAVPFFNATCPGGVEVHADAGGPVYINGSETKLKTFNANYYEAMLGETTLSISVGSDGNPSVSYSTSGGDNGVCTLGAASSGDNGASAGMSARQMVSYCKGEAAGQYNTRPSNVKADAPMPAVGGGYVVSGSMSLGAQGNPPFQCLFDPAGNFQSINWL